MTSINRTLVELAAEACAVAMQWRQAADAVIATLMRQRHCGPREREVVADIVFTVMRRLRSLRALAGEEAGVRRLVLAALALHHGLSGRALQGLCSSAEATWLGELKARRESSLSLGEQLDLPDWLLQRLGARLNDEELAQLARALNQPAPLDIRVNSFKARRDDVLARLAADGLKARPMPLSPLCLRLEGKPSLLRHPLFLAGDIEIQDAGSQLPALLLAPRRGEMVVDFCAGGGGKTLQLGAMMHSSGRLYACDTSAPRLSRLKPRLARSGLSNVHPLLIAHENDAHLKRLGGKCARVLVDAPCSGVGVLRRSPDLKWRRSESDLANLTQRQGAILAAAARLLKPGGRLVYATCSLLEEENGAIVDAFLAARPDFSRRNAAELLAARDVKVVMADDDLRLTPHQHDCDGFYAAVLERAA